MSGSRGVHPLPCASRHRQAGRLPFASSAQRFAGDWFEAAQIYRQWAVQTPHYRKRIRNNAMRDIAVWLWNRGGAEHVIAAAGTLTAATATPFTGCRRAPAGSQLPIERLAATRRCLPA